VLAYLILNRNELVNQHLCSTFGFLRALLVEGLLFVVFPQNSLLQRVALKALCYPTKKAPETTATSDTSAS